MTLGEKIYYYRKKCRLSQEELAAQVGVSRQAVSKWELGEATPELEKLLSLSRIFSITTDQLLSPEPPEEPSNPTPRDPVSSLETSSAFPQGIGWLGRLVRRYGWLAGVYVALCGLGITVVGVLARVMYHQMFPQDFFQVFGDSQGFGNPGSPFLTLATAILVIGILAILSGVVLAAILYQKGRKED